MAEFKRQTFFFSNGKQIKLYGTGFGVTRTLEITEASAPNVFGLIEGQEGGKPTTTICNPYKLTAEEIMEVADYCIRQWMDVKDNVRRYGVDSPKVFNRENFRPDSFNFPTFYFFVERPACFESANQTICQGVNF